VPHLYYHVVIHSEFAANSFLQAMLSKRLPHLRTFFHTLVVSRARYTQYQFIAVREDETYEAKYQAQGYYPDGPYATQIDQILRWLNHPTCQQSWQNLLVHRTFLTTMETTTCHSPPQLTITGVGESCNMDLGVSNVRRLRFPNYMTLGCNLWTRFLSLTHLGMVVYRVYRVPYITRRIIDVILRLRTLERLAVVIVPPPSATSRADRPMGNAIYQELLEVDDERLVVLEEEIGLLKMLRQPDGDPFWRRVDEVADHVKKNGKVRPSYLL